MKQYLFLILFTISISCFAQDSLNYYNKNIETRFKKNDLNGSDLFFHRKLNYLKNQNNLEEYFYAHFDYFLLNPKLKRIFILENADKNKWRNPNTNNEKIAKLHVFANIAYHFKIFGAISESVIIDEKLLVFYQSNLIKNYNIIENCIKRLANNYIRLGDFIRAETILKSSINLLETNNNKKQLIATYLNLSNLYQLISKPNKANNILHYLIDNYKLSKQQKATVYSKIALNYYDLDKLDLVSYNIKKSKKLNSNSETQITNYKLNGLVFYTKKQYQNANTVFISAINLATKIHGVTSREVAKIRILLAKNHTKINLYDDALKNYQIALRILLPEFKSVNFNDNPSSSYLFAENTLIDAFEGKAQIYRLQNKNKLAISNLVLANTVANLLRKTYTSQQSKIIQQSKNRKRTEEIVQLYYDLYKTTNDKKYLEKIFLNIEKSKAIVLNDALIYKKSKHTKDSIFIQREKLEKQKAFVNNKIKLEELKEGNANINLIKNQLAIKTNLTSKLQVLNEKIKNNYPFLNLDEQQITVQKIQQNLLKENQIVISFFETKSNWFIFSLNKTENLKLRVLPKTETLNKEISNYINLFFYGNGSSIKNNVNAYQETAYFLYQKFLQPELEQSYKYLTIIPDKKLNFISFDALLTKETASSNFANFPYLVKDVAINMTFSANILYLLKQEQLQKTEFNYLGYFPLFKNKERNLQYLPNTLEEQNSFKKYTKATCFMEQKATKKHFLEHYKNYNQIHLATHASAGGFLNPAIIEFYDETLYLPEIYGLNMQTDLLVLSACETGVGKIQKGEGIMSLARGFTYAGVKNLVVSLWKVNDKATSELMRSFYKHLKNNSKTNAIHKAKLDYLNNKDISSLKKSPYYWSGFVFVGNVELVATNNYSKYIIVFGFLLLSLLIFILKIRKKK